MKNGLYVFLFLGLLLSSCAKTPDNLPAENQSELDEQIILDYIAANNLDAQKLEENNGFLYYVIANEGEGTAHPDASSEVQVDYKGYLTDGSVFDEPNTPVVFTLNSVIRGWTKGIPLFKKNGEGILLIPSDWAYGSAPPPGIPANAVLIFDIRLLDFE